MSLPGTMAYGNVDSLDAASGVVDASGYLKVSTSNAQQTIHIASPSDADEDEEELIDDRKKASPSDAEFDGEDVFAKIYDFIWQDPEEYLNDGRILHFPEKSDGNRAGTDHISGRCSTGCKRRTKRHRMRRTL